MIVMIGIKCLTSEFLMQTAGSMLIDINHDDIRLTEVVFAPVVTVRDAAFNDWLFMTHYLSPRTYCLHGNNQLFPFKMSDHDMDFPLAAILANTKKPPKSAASIH